VSIQPRHDLIERLVSELKLSKIQPEVIAQAAVAFRIIITSGGR
jgi:hypothetical protein